MYRKPSGKFGFHAINIFGDLPGSLSSSSGADPGHISLSHQDSLYLYQLQFPSPQLLTSESLTVAQIVGDASTARKIFTQLQKIGLLSQDGEVQTSAFDKPGFGKECVSALGMIPVSRQKQVVDLVFWWDEEGRRLEKLLGEKEELVVLLRDGMAEGGQQERERVQGLLDRVVGKINTRPSQRDEVLERDGDLQGASSSAGQGGEGELPAYER